ncbi:MAG: adenylate/guanylate cyclase domain-containing protein [Planctomycetota bacterium]
MPETCQLTYELNGVHLVHDLLGDRVVIGRSEECDLTIPDDSVSRVHATLERKGGEWRVSDQKSRNGTYVNWRKVQTSVIRDQDRVTLGRIELLVRIDDRSSGLHISDHGASSSVVDHTLNVQDFQQQLLDTASNSSAVGPESPSGSEDRASQWTVPLFSRVAEILISAQDMEAMLEALLEVVFGSLPADRGCLFLLDEATGKNKLEVMRTRSGRLTEPVVISSTVVRQVIENKNAVIVLDSASDAQLASQESIIFNQIQSAICAPLYHEGRVVGLIYLDSQRIHRRFERQHLEVLTTLALLFAAGVEQVRLRDRIREEERIRLQLERYSAPSVVDRIVRSERGGQMLSEEVQATVLFLDIVSFTAIAEELDASEVILVLNGLFAALTDCVFRHEGTLDKFTGDGLIAIFGAPLPLRDHAHRAVRAALDMQDAMTEYNRTHARTISVRIGINSGSMVAGDIGHPRRKDYTVIGDTVNIASRLESQIALPDQVVVGPETFRLTKDAFESRELGTLQVKGKKRQVPAYLVLRATETRAHPGPQSNPRSPA